jgi:hypothetical protein
VQEIIPADGLDRERVIEAGLAIVGVVILCVVVDVLRRQAVGRKKRLFFGGEKRFGSALPLRIKADGLVVERPEFFREVVVLLGVKS